MGRPPRERIAEIGDRYGLPFAQPDWLAEIVERYNLTPPSRNDT